MDYLNISEHTQSCGPESGSGKRIKQGTIWSERSGCAPAVQRQKLKTQAYM